MSVSAWLFIYIVLYIVFKQNYLTCFICIIYILIEHLQLWFCLFLLRFSFLSDNTHTSYRVWHFPVVGYVTAFRARSLRWWVQGHVLSYTLTCFCHHVILCSSPISSFLNLNCLICRILKSNDTPFWTRIVIVWIWECE